MARDLQGRLLSLREMTQPLGHAMTWPAHASAWIMILLAVASTRVPALGEAADTDYFTILDRLDPDRAWSIVDHLANSVFDGRKSGTQAADLASDYIAGYFGSIGLESAGEHGTYVDEFAVPFWQLEKMPSLELVDDAGKVAHVFSYRRDFYIQPGSGSGDYTAEVAFVGYGITASSTGYDDYANVSASGRIVLAIIGTPPSGFSDSAYATWYSKAENALSHGAVGLILVDSPAQPTPHYIEKWSGGWAFYDRLAILRGSIAMADILLRKSGQTLLSVQSMIDRNLKPQSFLAGIKLHISLQADFRKDVKAHNVLGFIRGYDPTASERALIIGAHYDHLGKDVDGSIFSGANDDASGVAVLMEVARVFSSSARSRWSILFAAWSGEEEGFYGSYAYVNHPYFPLAGTIAYLNLDLVGYGQPLTCEVSATYSALRTVVTESAHELGISAHVRGFIGSSDHAVFEERKVPNLMFIYWPDELYHTPADKADHVSRENLIETARLTALVALRLSEASIATTTAGEPFNAVFAAQLLLVGAVAVIVSVGFVVLWSRRLRQRV